MNDCEVASGIREGMSCDLREWITGYTKYKSSTHISDYALKHVGHNVIVECAPVCKKDTKYSTRLRIRV
jgi:hypothetical protein